MGRRSDIDEIVRRAREVLPRPVWYPLTQSGEAAVVSYFLAMVLGEAGARVTRADGIADLNHVEVEYPLPRGKADIVVFHADGGATVIEVKDGGAGRRSVLAGLGQVASYAYQLGASRCPPRYIKKALMWSACCSIEDDAHITDVCIETGVIPMQMGSVDAHHEATEGLVRSLLKKIGEGGGEK